MERPPGTPSAPHERRAGYHELLEIFRGPVIAGRWLLVGAEALEAALLLWLGAPGWPAIFALVILFVYNAASLLYVHFMPIRRAPIHLAVALDLALVGLVAYHTGGARSPFLPQCYLIIFAASLFFGMRGGLIIGGIAALMAVFLAPPDADEIALVMRDPVPYFLAAGAFAGYLVNSLRHWFLRYRDSQREARERAVEAEVRRREMELARSVQQASLPLESPRVTGLEVAYRTEFAREVGGDFLLFLPADARLGIVLGDVSGKGFSAALVATSIQHLLPWLRPLHDPAGALERLNRDLAERLPQGAFVTLVLAEVRPEEEAIRLWSAGHPPALFRSAAQGSVSKARISNRLLGIFPQWEAEREEHPFAVGDVLVLYSDGLTEVKSPEGEEFGTERIAEVLARSGGGSAEEAAEAIMTAVKEWGAPTDDLTLAVCRRLRPGESAGERDGGGEKPRFAPGS